MGCAERPRLLGPTPNEPHHGELRPPKLQVERPDALAQNSPRASAARSAHLEPAHQNDLWTATRPGGGPYQPNKMSYFKPTPPAVYRYQR